MAIRGVIYDMDGVLCDSEPFILEAATRMFRERHGCAVQPSDFQAFVGAGEDRYLGGVAEKHGIAIQLPEDKVYTYKLYLDIIRGRLEPLPGAREHIRACRERGWRQAVATSADRMKMEGNLAALKLGHDLFDALVYGERVTRKKPFPDIFLLACELLGLPPADCVVFEDAPNGIRAARAAGCRAVGITSSFGAETLIEAGADWIAPDLASVPSLT